MTLTPELESKIKILVESLGFGLYEILNVKENENQILRICITKESGGVSLDDCQEVSLALSPLLEVSSPGIERNLKKLEHYKGAINELVKVKTIDKKEFKGKLLSVEDTQIVLEGGIIIPLDSIKKAQTYFQW